MKRSTALLTLALATGAIGVPGCASDDAAQGGDDSSYENTSKKIAREEQTRWEKGRRHERPPAMRLENELGVLDTVEVEDALQARFSDVRACYQRAGKAQQYAGGRVLMRFLVAGTGQVDDVWVIDSSLGNYSVERCLVEVGRSVVFNAPTGHKSTTFEYPVEFRSTNQLEVQEIDGLKIDHDLATFLPSLAPCGRLAAEPVTIIMYIQPNGFPGSVGLSVAGELDEDAGDCAVQTIRTWKMSASLPGRILRANFRAPTVLASAEPPRRAVSSASVRRRRR